MSERRFAGHVRVHRQLPAPMSEPVHPSAVPTILVVDDEPSLRRLTVRLLVDEGYEVLDAGDGSEALELASARGFALDLLITDVRLPGLTGPELAARLRERIPKLPVLFVSGLRDSRLAVHGLSEDQVSLLLKPYRLEQLTEQVAAMLTPPAPPPPR